MPALIVEDGSGVATANTYQDLDTLKTYQIDRGREDEWCSIANKTQAAAAILAAQRMNTDWVWRGRITYPDLPQPLAFPRCGVGDSEGRVWAEDVIPPAVIAAQAELAWVIANDDLGKNPERADMLSERIGDYSYTRDLNRSNGKVASVDLIIGTLGLYRNTASMTFRPLVRT